MMKMMKFGPFCAALLLAAPVAAVAQASPETHVLAWHPTGKTPAAIPQTRTKRVCTQAADHHRGSKGPATPVVRCNTVEMANMVKPAPQTAELGE